MHGTVMVAAGWISTGTSLGNDIKGLIFNVGIPVLCGAFILVVGWRTKAPGPTIIACILGAVVWGLSANMSVLKDKTTEDITQYNGSTTVQRSDR